MTSWEGIVKLLRENKINNLFKYRSGELEDVYADLRPQELRSAWNSFKDGDDFALWMSEYFSSLQNFLVEEHRTMGQLFGNAKIPFILSKMLLKITAPISNELAIRLEDGVKRNYAAGNSTALVTYKSAENFIAVACKILATGSHLSAKVITDTLLAVIAGFIQFSDQFVDSSDAQLKNLLTEMIDETVYFDVCLNDSLFDDAFEEENNTSKAVAITGRPNGRAIIQSLDSDNLEDLVGLLERYSEKLLQLADESFAPLTCTIQNNCEFVKGLRVKQCIKLSTSTAKMHLNAILHKISDMRMATGLNPIDISDRESSGKGNRRSEHSVASPPSSISLGSGGDSQESISGYMMNTTSDIALGVAKHYNLVGQEHTSVAKLFIPPALKCLQMIGRLFLSFIEFEATTGAMLQTVLVSLFQGVPFSEHIARLSAITSSNMTAQVTNGNTVGAMLICTLLESDLSGFSELKGFLLHAVDSVAKNRSLKALGVSDLGTQNITLSSYAEMSASSVVIFSGLTPILQKLQFAAGSLLLDLCTMAPVTILKDFSG